MWGNIVGGGGGGGGGGGWYIERNDKVCQKFIGFISK